jgi:hypothetical protein
MEQGERRMTKEELKQEAEAEADKVIIGSGMDRTSVIHLKHLLVTMYIQGATKVTKELEAQIEKMKCCYNCSKWNEGLLLCNESTVRVTTYADYCCEDWEIKRK